MDFHHPDGRQLSVLLPPRSLLIMTTESRYVWSHGITPRKSDIVPSAEGNLNVVPRGVRTSFTFRKIIHPAERRRREAQQGSVTYIYESNITELEKEIANAISHTGSYQAP